VFRGDVLRKLRLAAGLTQAALGARADAGISWQRISAWERGIEQPGPVYIPLLAAALGVDPFELLVGGRAQPTLQTLRLAAGLSLTALAEASGVSYSRCQRFEQGTAPMPSDAAARLAGVLGVPIKKVETAAVR
jgi:Predicted transcriptional regulators